MSNKEYEVKYDSYSKTYSVREKEDYDWEPNTDSTWRERLGEKIKRIPVPAKIILTLLGNLYGILYRIGSDSTLAFFIGFADIIGKFILAAFISIITIHPYPGSYFIFFLNPFLWLWIIDIISVIIRKDIVFIKGKKYLDYNEYKKKH